MDVPFRGQESIGCGYRCRVDQDRCQQLGVRSEYIFRYQQTSMRLRTSNRHGTDTDAELVEDAVENSACDRSANLAIKE